MKHAVDIDSPSVVMDALFCSAICKLLKAAGNRVYQTADSAMVKAYWQIDKGFTSTNLKYMRRFYLTFPNSHALRDRLSWTH